MNIKLLFNQPEPRVLFSKASEIWYLFGCSRYLQQNLKNLNRYNSNKVIRLLHRSPLYGPGFF